MENNYTTVCQDEAGLKDRDAFVAALGFWVEGAVVAAVSAAGLAGNAVAAPVLLSSRTPPSAFNRMLVFLSLFDALFLACCASEAVRRHLWPGSEIHLICFVRLLYPLQSAALMWSSYATVTLAAERYQAVCRPIEYHMATAASGPAGAWRRALKYMLPVVLLGSIYNVPKFFEMTVQPYRMENGPNETELVLRMMPTAMRLNDVYVFVYVNLGRLVMEGLVPFLALLFLNRGIHGAMRRRQAAAAALTAPPANGGGHSQVSPAADSEERRQALILTFIVLSFLLCSIPRIALDTYETAKVGTIRENFHNPCYRLPLWVPVTATISLLLMVLNSSINLLVYCVANPSFRRELLAHCVPCCGKNKAANGGGGASSAPAAPTAVSTV